MSKKLFLLHTVSSLIGTFKALCDEIMPDVEILNIVDESLLKDAVAVGGLTPSIYRRVSRYAASAQEAGAVAVLVTCSSISPCVDVAQRMVEIPVLKVDEAMADRAVDMGNKIGVIATLSTTLEPTTSLVKSRAALKGEKVSIYSVLCKGAFEALVAGDTATHDKIVSRELRKLMNKVDIVVLAQASMARVAESIEKRGVPILSSPRLGVERAKQVLENLQKGQ